VGALEVGQPIEMHVNNRRRAIMANHTATHLLNLALREVLGDHVEQRGSLVDDEKTRFDFSHTKALDPGEIERIDRRVNTLIQENVPVRAKEVPLAQAKSLRGVRAVFGEKYPDPVRVVYVCPGELEDGDGRMHSIEFCGGTHASRTGDIGFFKIIGEESVSKGVRRITAVTGEEALEYVQRMEADLKSIGQALSSPAEEAPARIQALREEVRTLKKKLASGGGGADPSTAAVRLLESAESLGGAKLVVGELPDATEEQLRQAVDAIKARSGSFAAMLASAGAEKVMFVAAVSEDLIKRGLKAGDWVRETASVAGGGGGGKPNLAQAGGKHPEKLADALAKAREVAQRALE
jgi:alanyl-tRNA synthetase